MKRVIAISNHGEMIGGGEQSFLDLVSHLPISWEVLATVPHEGELATRLRKSDIAVRVSALPSLRLRHALLILKALGSYVRTCRDVRPHLIYANGSRAAFYGGLAGQILRIPVIWHCRITDRDPYMDSLLSRLSTCIIVNSKATAKRFSPGLPGKVRVVYNGVDLGWLKQEPIRKPELIQEGWEVVLVVARVSRWKRHDLALSAFELVAASNTLVHLACVGSRDKLEPEWWKHLQERSRRSPFANRIHWTGQTEDIRPWYKAASVLLLPSDNEPFGRVLVEAMACGLPVVATRSGGVPEIVREGLDGLLAAPGSAHEISEHILKLFRDETLRNRISESGRKRAEEFSLETHVNRMVHVFEEALGYQAKRVGR